MGWVERREVGVEWWCARARGEGEREKEEERSEEKRKGEEEEAARWEEGIGREIGRAHV